MNLLNKFVSLSESIGVVSAFDLFSSNDQPEYGCLSLEELKICLKFASCKRRSEFVSGRVACKKAFFNFISEDMECFEKFSSVSVLSTEIGSPFIENSNLFASISHSYGIAIASVSQNIVGIDIEQIDPKRISALKRMSTEYSSENVRDLTVLWTLKESFSKALQTGIVKDFKYYETKNFRCRNGIYTCDFKKSLFSGIAISNDRYSIGMVVKKNKSS